MNSLTLLLLLLTLNPDLGQCQPKKLQQQWQTSQPIVVATAYCLQGQTSSGPTTAEVHRNGGCIALSRDLVKLLNAKFGDTIEIDGEGRFIFADLMPPQWSMRVDIYFPTYKACRVFGVKRRHIRKIGK